MFLNGFNDCKFGSVSQIESWKSAQKRDFWHFSKQLDDIWQNRLKCPLLRHYWCCHFYHPSLLLSLSYNPPSEISHVEKCIHLHSGTIQVFNRVNIKDLPVLPAHALLCGVSKKVTKIEMKIHQDMYLSAQLFLTELKSSPFEKITTS